MYEFSFPFPDLLNLMLQLKIDKQELRVRIGNDRVHSPILRKNAGRLAERLRRETAWRQAHQVFVGPAPLLSQIRINALLDGKDLIMPGPGLKDGFFLLAPYTIPFKRLPFAVTIAGLKKYGRLLADQELADLQVGLLVADALAFDNQGFCLGDGHGFFDLAYALLAAKGALTEGAGTIGMATGSDQLLDLAIAVDVWDVPLDRVLSPEGELTFQRPASWRPAINWEGVSMDRIRRITPLWKLYVEEREGR